MQTFSRYSIWKSPAAGTGDTVILNKTIAGTVLFIQGWSNDGGKDICLEFRYPYHVTTHARQTLPRLAVGTQQPSTNDLTLAVCTRYPLWLGGSRQCGIRSLSNAYTHGHYWELYLNLSWINLESNTLSTWQLGVTHRWQICLKCRVFCLHQYIYNRLINKSLPNNWHIILWSLAFVLKGKVL